MYFPRLAMRLIPGVAAKPFLIYRHLRKQTFLCWWQIYRPRVQSASIWNVLQVWYIVLDTYGIFTRYIYDQVNRELFDTVWWNTAVMCDSGCISYVRELPGCRDVFKVIVWFFRITSAGCKSIYHWAGQTLHLSRCVINIHLYPNDKGSI